MDIIIKDLYVRVNDHFNLNVPDLFLPKSSRVAIKGQNGSGKSTFLKAIVDFIPIEKGQILIDNISNKNENKWKTKAGIFFNKDTLPDFLYPIEYLEMVCKLKGFNVENFYSNEPQYFDFLGYNVRKRRDFIGNLSDGNKQKIGLLGAIVTLPNILLFDEPFNYLDDSSRRELLKILESLNSEQDSSIICSTHESLISYNFFTRIITFKDGKIV